MMSRRLSVCISLQDEYRSDWHERIATFVGHALLWHHGLHCNYVLFPCIHLLTGGDARIDKEMKSPNQWTDFCGLCKTPPPQVLCQHGCIYRIFVCPLFSSTRFPRPLCHPLGGGHRLQVAYHDRILTFRLQVIHTTLKSKSSPKNSIFTLLLKIFEILPQDIPECFILKMYQII